MATPRQVETSMSKKYKGTAKVSQTTIDNIKKMGMTASLKKAASSKNPEYLEGIKRMYGANRLAAAKKAVATPAGRMSPRVAERTPSVINRPSPRVVERTALSAGRKSARATEGATAKKSSGKGLTAMNIGKAIAGAAAATAAVVPAGKAIRAGKLAGALGSRAVQSATGRIAAKTTGQVTDAQFNAMRATKIAKAKKAAAYETKMTSKAKKK